VRRSSVFFVALVAVAVVLYFVFKGAAKAPAAGTPTIPDYSGITNSAGQIIS